MTKVICDICKCEASNQYSIPIWSNFDTDGITHSVPNHAKIKSVKIDLCEKCEKEIAYFIIKLLGDNHRGIKEKYDII